MDMDCEKKMKPRFVFWTLGLLAVMAVTACAPAVTTAPANPTEVAAPTLPPPSPTSTLQAASAPDISVPQSTPTIEIQAVATSRGPNLEATDPTTVSLASGGLQLVEFFRFT